MFCRSKLVVILALVLIPLAGCGGGSPAVSPLPTPAPQPTAGQMLHDIVANPDKYVGRQVTVEGVLEAEGQMPRVRFFLAPDASAGLRDGDDRLEVSPWAPLETIQPPQGGIPVKSMVYYVGRRLRLTGVLERGSEGLLLKVSVVEELAQPMPPHPRLKEAIERGEVVPPRAAAGTAQTPEPGIRSAAGRTAPVYRPRERGRGQSERAGGDGRLQRQCQDRHSHLF